MNRIARVRANAPEEPPHARGDEPFFEDRETVIGTNRPTPVGMNRGKARGRAFSPQPPHARGDEPGCGEAVRELHRTAPRPWG